MSDLINRADLLTHINQCLAEGDATTPIVNAVLTAIKCAVEQMPRVDAEPIVRCGNCVHRTNGYCEYHGTSVLREWFCWEGKEE